MIQKISVRILVEYKDHPLLLRRSDGRESLMGVYELPGGKVYENEQPEDAAHRYLRDDVGLETAMELTLMDAFTYHDRDERDFQYAVIVYRATLAEKARSVHLSDHYDKYIWYRIDEGLQDTLSDVTQIVLGIPQVPFVASGTEGIVSVDKETLIYTDGGSRGNPGPSAAGYVVVQNGAVVDQGSEYIGITTNNLAEYQGVVIGLEAAQRLGLRRFTLNIDSMLVVNQLNGIYAIKNRELWPVSERVKELVGTFEQVRFVHIPRELNQLADGMVNRALDNRKQEETSEQ